MSRSQPTHPTHPARPTPSQTRSHGPRQNRSSADVHAGACELPSPMEEGREPTPVELAEALFAASHAFKQWGNLCFSQAGPGLRELSVPRGRVLAAMADALPERVRMGDLSAALGVTARNITTIVDGLEREGLLVRQPDPSDRRAILLELTAKGHEQIAQVFALQYDLAERMFGALDADERHTLYTLLARLARRAHQATASRDREPSERPV